MFEDDFTEILSAEFKSSFENWLKSIYSQKASKREETSTDTDPKGQYFKIKKKEEKNEFDKFSKEIFDLESPEYIRFKTQLSQLKEPAKYFSLFFDIIIRIVIKEKGVKMPILKFDEYYTILSSNFQNSLIQANPSLRYESETSNEQSSEPKTEGSSFTEQSYERKLLINHETVDFITESIVNNSKLVKWINLEYWADFYSDKHLDDKRLKSSLRNLILMIKMLEHRKERYKKMGIVIKN
ncbi:MAG: hypothetical protein ACXACO_10960 [Promethearchaeota archaeon]|jgi:hypothetical protein